MRIEQLLGWLEGLQASGAMRVEVLTCDVCGERRECDNVHRLDPEAPASGVICVVCTAEAEAGE